MQAITKIIILLVIRKSYLQEYRGWPQGAHSRCINKVVACGVVKFAVVEEVASFDAEFGLAVNPGEGQVGEDDVAMIAGNGIVEVMFDGTVQPEAFAQRELAGEALLQVGEAGKIVAAFYPACYDRAAATVEELSFVGKACCCGEPPLPQAAAGWNQLLLPQDLGLLPGAVQRESQGCGQRIDALAVSQFEAIAVGVMRDGQALLTDQHTFDDGAQQQILVGARPGAAQGCHHPDPGILVFQTGRSLPSLAMQELSAAAADAAIIRHHIAHIEGIHAADAGCEAGIQVVAKVRRNFAGDGEPGQEMEMPLPLVDIVREASIER